ncbi:MAG: PD40 domain-containing protein [Chloroflexi bacterium]|uniref:PD40 domain-containing protein n=1 Tax=Candidatus Chlorohelix allophototropha TaxID=3003348 RepID=A0A8T7M1Z4_9CHLR|nr:PD40 domain-containing protein [Chloroflexota bacterium]WJW65680.1 hypothetical protein OZ401_001458 [Chloroflexota bacterium L227-S17]
MNKFPYIATTLFVLTLILSACGDSSTTAAPSTTFSTISTRPSQTTQSSPANALTPLVGPDGQITVVAPTATVGNFKGSFFYVKNNNIWQGGIGLPGIPPVSTTKLGGIALTNVSALAITKTPALSPDGQTLAYAYSPDPEIKNGRTIIGQDIMTLDLKTKAAKVLMERQEPDMFLEDPAWSPDGKYLYASYRSPERDKTGAVIGQKVGIQRLELATGNRETLVQDAREPVPTPDGKSLVFIGVAASTMTFDYSFKVLDLATKQERELIKPELNFLSYYFPRISPDGQWVVFAGVGGPEYSANSPTATPSIGSVQGLALHGMPYDLWLIKTDGTNLRRLTVLFEDQPMASWSKDGKQIIFLAGQGFYTVEVDTGKLSKKSDEGAHGGFDYRE